MIDFGPLSLSRSTAATAELPVASIGSTTITSRSCMLAGHLEVVLDRHQRLGIAVQADVADARAGHELEHAVEDAGAGAQDRDEHQLLAVEHRAASCVSSGVSISISCVGRSRVTS